MCFQVESSKVLTSQPWDRLDLVSVRQEFRDLDSDGNGAITKQEFMNVGTDDCSTCPFTILEPQNQEIGELYVVQVRRVTVFEASKL